MAPDKSAKNSTSNKPELQLLLEGQFGASNYLRNEPIGTYLVNGIGGIAEHLVIAEDTGAIVAAARAAITAKQPYFIVAHGTGSLVSQIGFPGLVIINKTNNIACSASTSEALVDSGVSNAELVNVLASKSFGALEFLSVIPGTIGGAVATGAGYDGKYIRTYVKELIMFVADAGGGTVISVLAADLPKREGLRMFEASENAPIILSVRLQLARISEAEIMRRLGVLRKHSAAQQQAVSTVGYFLYPFLDPEQVNSKEFKSIKLEKGIRLLKKDCNLLEFKEGNTPVQIRRAVRDMEAFLRESGCTLEERLAYLGYWPSKEEYTNTSDAESFSI